METKLFEIRDHATCIAALATRPNQYDNSLVENRLWSHAGFGRHIDEDARTLVILTHLNNHRTHYDHYDWGDRTMQNAHQYIETHWDELQSGAVVDVRFILKEADAPAASDLLNYRG